MAAGRSDAGTVRGTGRVVVEIQSRYSDKGPPDFVLDPEVLVPAQSTGEK